MAIFKVVQQVPVTRYEEQVLFETDDWVEAEAHLMRVQVNQNPSGVVGPRLPEIKGTHPTHDFDGERCTKCGSYDNGSYGSHAPCGYDFKGRSLVQTIKEETDGR